MLPGIGTIAYHWGGVLDPSSWYTALLSGMFNITPEPTVLEVVAWIAYGVPVLLLFLWRPRRKEAALAVDKADKADKPAADQPISAPAPQL